MDLCVNGWSLSKYIIIIHYRIILKEACLFYVNGNLTIAKTR